MAVQENLLKMTNALQRSQAEDCAEDEDPLGAALKDWTKQLLSQLLSSVLNHKDFRNGPRSTREDEPAWWPANKVRAGLFKKRTQQWYKKECMEVLRAMLCHAKKLLTSSWADFRENVNPKQQVAMDKVLGLLPDSSEPESAVHAELLHGAAVATVKDLAQKELEREEDEEEYKSLGLTPKNKNMGAETEAVTHAIITPGQECVLQLSQSIGDPKIPDGDQALASQSPGLSGGDDKLGTELQEKLERVDNKKRAREPEAVAPQEGHLPTSPKPSLNSDPSSGAAASKLGDATALSQAQEERHVSKRAATDKLRDPDFLYRRATAEEKLDRALLRALVNPSEINEVLQCIVNEALLSALRSIVDNAILPPGSEASLDVAETLAPWCVRILKDADADLHVKLSVNRLLCDMCRDPLVSKRLLELRSLGLVTALHELWRRVGSSNSLAALRALAASVDNNVDVLGDAIALPMAELVAVLIRLTAVPTARAEACLSLSVALEDVEYLDDETARPLVQSLVEIVQPLSEATRAGARDLRYPLARFLESLVSREPWLHQLVNHVPHGDGSQPSAAFTAIAEVRGLIESADEQLRNMSPVENKPSEGSSLAPLLRVLGALLRCTAASVGFDAERASCFEAARAGCVPALTKVRDLVGERGAELLVRQDWAVATRAALEDVLPLVLPLVLDNDTLCWETSPSGGEGGDLFSAVNPASLEGGGGQSMGVQEQLADVSGLCPADFGALPLELEEELGCAQMSWEEVDHLILASLWS